VAIDLSKSPVVVVADDEYVVREMLSRRLKMEHLDVRAVDRGDEAVKIAKDEFVNVILTDIKMPGLSGVGVLRQVKEVSPDTAVIMMTAHASAATAVEALRLGAFDYLSKPFEHIDDVVHKINLALRSQRLELQNRELVKKLEEANRGLKQIVASRTREIVGTHGVEQQVWVDVRAKLSEMDAAIVPLLGIPGAPGEHGQRIARLVEEVRAAVAQLPGAHSP
jgi:DNA-binding NtrC family response regulator